MSCLDLNLFWFNLIRCGRNYVSDATVSYDMLNTYGATYLPIPDAPWCWNIYLQNWAIFGVNVGKYSIHGAYGYAFLWFMNRWLVLRFDTQGYKARYQLNEGLSRHIKLITLMTDCLICNVKCLQLHFSLSEFAPAFLFRLSSLPVVIHGEAAVVAYFTGSLWLLLVHPGGVAGRRYYGCGPW